MKHIQNLLDYDTKINLTEVVTQNKDVIKSKLNLEVNSLESDASQIVNLLKGHDSEALEEAFKEYYKANKGNRMFLAQLDGTTVFINGDNFSISGRKYFIAYYSLLHLWIMLLKKVHIQNLW